MEHGAQPTETKKMIGLPLYWKRGVLRIFMLLRMTHISGLLRVLVRRELSARSLLTRPEGRQYLRGGGHVPSARRVRQVAAAAMLVHYQSSMIQSIEYDTRGSSI